MEMKPPLPPLPPFSLEVAIAKVQTPEDTWHDDSGFWYRAYANDVPIQESERKFRWEYLS